jgi:two-component system cell cycle sensor histidine kinase/response regulator CckA
LERDRAIIEHAADAFFVYDARGSIFDINRRACETLGYRRKELLSLCMTDVEAILLPEGIAGLWRRLASGELVATEGAQRRKDGGRHGFPRRDPGRPPRRSRQASVGRSP